MSLASQLRLYYECNETSGSLIDAVAANNLAETSSPGIEGTIVGGIPARTFSRNDTECMRASDASWNNFGGIGSFTIFFLAYPTAWTGAALNCPIAKDETNQREFILYHQTSGDRYKLEATTNGQAGTAVTLVASSHGNVATGAWHSVLLGWDSVAAELFIRINNGTEDRAAIASIHNGTGTFNIGGTFGAAPAHGFDGHIARVAVFDGLLTEGEKTALYNGGNGRTYSQIRGNPPLYSDNALYGDMALYE